LTQAAILIAAVVSIIAWPQILDGLGLSRPASILATVSHGIVVFVSLAGIVVLMSWLWISSVVLLISAELNQVIEDASPFARRHKRRPERGATLDGKYLPARFSK